MKLTDINTITKMNKNKINNNKDQKKSLKNLYSILF